MKWLQTNYRHLPSVQIKKLFEEIHVGYTDVCEFERMYKMGKEIKRVYDDCTKVSEKQMSVAEKMELSIEQSTMKGTGNEVYLTLAEGIEADSFLGFYGGCVVEDKGEKVPYSVVLTSDLLLNGDAVGNEFRFLQHSHNPTVELLRLEISTQKLDGMVIGVFSVVPHPAGKTELTMVYSSFPQQIQFWDVCMWGPEVHEISVSA